jgi:hypothetical protein
MSTPLLSFDTAHAAVYYLCNPMYPGVNIALSVNL